MRITLRADADSELGSGHFYRCLSLADFAARRGHVISFLGHVPNQLYALEIKKRCLSFKSIPSESRDLDGDTALTLNHLAEFRSDVIVVDRPNLVKQWEERIRRSGIRLVVIDDRPSRSHDVDLLISTALFFNNDSPLSWCVADGVPTLAGPTFLPLRPEFTADRSGERTGGSVSRVGAFFGGTDPGDQIAVVLAIAALPQFAHIAFDIVCGALNQSFTKWTERCLALPNVSVVLTVPNMADFWRGKDVAIGSYGMSAWERCAVGLPTIATIQVPDQVDDALALSAMGAVLDIGWSHELTAQGLAKALASLMSSPRQLISMSLAASRVMEDRQADSERCLALIIGLEQTVL